MQENTETKKRGKYITKKKLELANLLIAAKEFQFQHKREATPVVRNAQTIAEFTKDSCMYPSRYLNNDDTCVKCDIYEYCACSIKNLGKRKRNE